jgi:hypothetical protein
VSDDGEMVDLVVRGLTRKQIAKLQAEVLPVEVRERLVEAATDRMATWEREERDATRAEEVPDDHPARDLPFGHPFREAMGVGDEDLAPVDVDRLANDLAADWRVRAERAERMAATWKDRLVSELARLRGLLREQRNRAERAERDVRRLRAWQAAYAEGRAGLVRRAELDRVEANAQRERAERAEAEIERRSREGT